MIFLQILQAVDIQIVQIINIIIFLLNIPLQIFVPIFINNDIRLDLINHPYQSIVTNSFNGQYIFLLLDFILSIDIILHHFIPFVNKLLQFVIFLLYSSVQLLQLFLFDVLVLLDIFELHSLI